MFKPNDAPSKRKEVLVQLDEAMVASLDEVSQEERLSRSAVIRDAVTAYFEARMARSIDQQIIDGYTRMPQTDDDDLAAFAEAGAREAIEEEPW